MDFNISKKLKKILTLSFCGFLFLNILPKKVEAKTFEDVETEGGFGWVYKDVDYLSNLNIIDGYPDGTFKPQKPVAFLEVAQILYKSLSPSEKEKEASLQKYGPVCENLGVPSWARPAVSFILARGGFTEKTLNNAKSLGMLKDKNPTYPDRNSVSVYIARSLGFNNEGDLALLKHKDVANIPDSVKGYLANLIRENIFAPTGSDGFFNGSKFIRRAEMASATSKILFYIQNEVKQEEAEANKEDFEIQCEVLSAKLDENSHIYDMQVKIKKSNNISLPEGSIQDFKYFEKSFYDLGYSFNLNEVYSFRGKLIDGKLVDMSMVNINGSAN